MVEGALARLAAVVSRRRRAVVAVWLALLLAGGWFSLHESDRLSGGGWEIPGSASVRASRLLDRFPVSSPVFTVFVRGRSPAAVAARLRHVRARLAADPQVHPHRARLLAGGRAALLPAGYSGPVTATIDAATRIRHELVADSPGTTTRVLGTAAIWSNFQDVSKQQLRRGESIGFPLILLILLVGFGTVVAAVAPLALGFAAVFLSGAVIYWLSRSFEMSVYVTNMASMIGIGVAVDYSLFVVSRFRRELREGRAQDEALRRALASSGTAVVFSGATVAVSLAALFAVRANAIRSMAIGAIVVVLISVLASVTLLPALLAAVGPRVERWRVRLPSRTGESGDPRFWTAWTARVMRRPVTMLALAAGVLLVVASPLLALRTLNRGIGELPRSAEVPRALAEAQRLAGAGFAGPAYVISPRLPRLAALRGVPGVASVAPPVASRDHRLWVTFVTLAQDPESFAANATYRRLRAAAGPDAVIGGTTAFDLDVRDAVVGGLWKMLLFILGVSYVVLLLLLRSVLLPLKAVLMNLLSVGAAYGVLVAVFQWGWLDWAGYRSPGYIDTIVPALVLAVTFGLSMDYEVFLLTRIRERWTLHGDNERAVSEGLVASARTITSAAAVMVAVFAAFAVAGAPSLKELGVGLAVAILVDATLVRLVIVPAAMRLLGPWNWWAPSLSRASARPSPARVPAP
ncbi:MAG: putative drug exporter of the superfamily [Actinomycetota bacterium]|jgi:RND superfamily putative drug exporter